MAAKRKITVYVNDEPGRFFLGLRVRHAIGYQDAWRVTRGEATVQDGNGNHLDLEGALYEGERLYIQSTTPTQSC
jgi:hypothetical protein